MLNSSHLSGLRRTPMFLSTRTQAGEATDPIQKLFLEKIREYRQRSEGGKLVDATPEVEKELTTELGKLDKQYGVDAAVDMSAFPSFKFDEPKLDPIDEPIAPPPGQQAKKGDKKDDTKKEEKK